MMEAIICDLDGTLFDCEWRRKFLPNFDLFSKKHTEDKINSHILEIIKRFKNDHKIIFISGRSETFKKTSQEQLNQYIDDYALFMRQEGDFRPDEVIKQEIYLNHIQKNYNVLFILDDRSKVVNMWRKLGLFCLQVNDGDF